MVHNYLQHENTKSRASGIATVSIVGARGYSGLELAKLLLQHPAVTLTHCFATQAFDLGQEILNEKAKSVKCLSDAHIMENLTDIVFLATPAEVSLTLAPKILAAGKTVIDLSGAFRLKKNDVMKWYGFAHTQTEWLQKAKYGLQPFCKPSSRTDVELIANPGCYATAISLALIPLFKHGLIESSGLVIDAKSGTTGAGRKANENLLFSEVAGECLPYKVGKHQHTPEIQEAVQAFGGAQIAPHFATHLLPTARGIVASIYANAKTSDVGDIAKAYEAEYSQYPLVRFGQNIAQLAQLKHVVGTPFTHISFELHQNKLYLFATLDNLLKGAATQAVENLNQRLDLPLTYSLNIPSNISSVKGE
jgi:N-acetyl-gamma-glutamyl-phosphate reductase